MGSDYVLFYARTDIARTNVPMTAIAGVPNVRVGMGTPKLKSVRTFYKTDAPDAGNPRAFVHLKNSSWVRELEIVPASWTSTVSLADELFGFAHGRDAVLKENSIWNITTEGVSDTTGTFFDVYCLLEIDYSAVPTNDIGMSGGYPMTIPVVNMPAVSTLNTPVLVSTPDNLDPGVSYLLEEIRGNSGASTSAPLFLMITGFQSQNGLNTIIPYKSGTFATTDVAVQIKSSYKLTKQAYNLSVISQQALPANHGVTLQLVASSNSI